jgi:small GTP-binding protein
MDNKVETNLEFLNEIKNYKVLFLGDSGVGKSSIINRLIKNNKKPNIIPTICIDFFKYTIELENKILNKNKLINFAIWDASGIPTFLEIIRSYYIGSHYIVIVFDLTDYDSFLNIKKWYNEIRKLEYFDKLKCLLFGNKNDKKDKRVVSENQAREIADNYGFEYYEISTIDNNQNIRNIFNEFLIKSIKLIN